MNIPQHIGAGVIQDLITTLETQEVTIQIELHILQLGAHGAIANEDAALHGLEEWVIRGSLGELLSKH